MIYAIRLSIATWVGFGDLQLFVCFYVQLNARVLGHMTIILWTYEPIVSDIGRTENEQGNIWKLIDKFGHILDIHLT